MRRPKANMCCWYELDRGGRYCCQGCCDCRKMQAQSKVYRCQVAMEQDARFEGDPRPRPIRLHSLATKASDRRDSGRNWFHFGFDRHKAKRARLAKARRDERDRRQLIKLTRPVVSIAVRPLADAGPNWQRVSEPWGSEEQLFAVFSVNL